MKNMKAAARFYQALALIPLALVSSYYATGHYILQAALFFVAFLVSDLLVSRIVAKVEDRDRK